MSVPVCPIPSLIVCYTWDDGWECKKNARRDRGRPSVSQFHCVQAKPQKWDTTTLVHNGIGLQREWGTLELGYIATDGCLRQKAKSAEKVNTDLSSLVQEI